MRHELAIIFFVVASAAIATGQDADSPKLLICGGGNLPESIFERFHSLAGPMPRLVVIPTASSRKVDVGELRELWKSRGFGQVQVLHSIDRNEASSPDFVAPLSTATAVWIGGGSQQRLADAYLDTPVEEELHRLVRRGGVIGGTSAGAAIQSRVMIASGRSEPQLSTGFDLLPKAIVDQHFLQRNRLSRLLAAVRAEPRLVGYGIDEGTALVVQGGEAKVLGASYVVRVESLEGKVKLDSYGSGETVPLQR